MRRRVDAGSAHAYARGKSPMNEVNRDRTAGATAVEPTLKLNFLSHGTLESKDLEFTRRFYEQFLGFEVVRASKVSIWCRLGGQHVYVVVEVPPQRKAEMPFLNHNGIDVATEDDVDECHRLVDARRRAAGDCTRSASPPVQHGTYSFYFWDADDNSWEILANPPGGYTWMFERGDQEGMGHMSKKFDRPASTLRKEPKD